MINESPPHSASPGSPIDSSLAHVLGALDPVARAAGGEYFVTGATARPPALDRPTVFRGCSGIGSHRTCEQSVSDTKPELYRLGYAGHLGQGFPPEALTDLSERGL